MVGVAFICCSFYLNGKYSFYNTSTTKINFIIDNYLFTIKRISTYDKISI